MAHNYELLRLLSIPVAPLYWLAVRVRNKLFDKKISCSKAVSVPVISVGNLTTGGTGKTPLTIYLAKAMTKAGWYTKIISRGYGGKQQYGPMAVASDSDIHQTGDEPLMMTNCLGSERVIVGRNRYQAALLALSSPEKPNLLIMDDGFQHRSLKRDLDLLLLDGSKCWGNGLMLPFGNLREPISSAARASCLVVTRSNKADQSKITQWWHKLGNEKPIFWLNFSIIRLRTLDHNKAINTNDPDLNNKMLYAFCAIGNPQAFFNDLTDVGLTLGATKSFRDHQQLTKEHMQQLQDAALASGAHFLVCTEKDAVKLSPNSHWPVPILVAEQQLIGGEQLVSWLIQKLTPYKK